MGSGDIAVAHQLSFDTFVELDTRLGDPVPDHTEALRARGTARIAHQLHTRVGGRRSAALS